MKTITTNIILALLLLLTTSVAFGLDSNLKRAQFTTQISKKEPVDNLKRIDTSFKALAFFTEVVKCKGCTVTHQWWFEGKMVYEKDSYIKHNRYRWWTKKRVNPNNPGKWTVKVIIDEWEVHKASIKYYIPTTVQKNKAPIQKRLQQKSLGQCEKKLGYFHKKTQDHPNDPYYAFMFKKWGKRCFESN